MARGWAGLAPIDDRDDCFAVGEVNQQALFGRVAAVVLSPAASYLTGVMLPVDGGALRVI